MSSEAVAAGDVAERVEIARCAEHVHGEDGLGLAGDPRLDVDRVEVERVVDLGEHRCRPGVDDRRHRRNEREPGDDDFVAGADAECRQQDPDRTGAGVDRDRMTDADQLGDAVLERQHLGAEGGIIVGAISAEVAAAQHAGHCFYFALIDQIISWAWHGSSSCVADDSNANVCVNPVLTNPSRHHVIRRQPTSG